MPFPRPTLLQIISRIESDILSRVTTGFGILRRSILRVLARVYGSAINLTFSFIDWLSNQLFVVTATDVYLERHGDKWGKTRQQATFSSGNIDLTGINGTDIPSGTVYQNEDGGEYETQSLVTIALGQATVDVLARLPGADYNRVSLAILNIAQPIAGLDDLAFVATGGLTGGTDIESDEDLRDRILSRIRNPPMAGDANDYIIWAKDTIGVNIQKAWQFAHYDGPNSVALFFMVSGWNLPNQSEIDSVQAELVSKAPITARPLTFAPVKREMIYIIKLNPNTTDVQNAVIASLTAMFEKDTDVAMVLFKLKIDEAISTATGEINHEIIGMLIDTNPFTVGDIYFGSAELPFFDTASFVDY